jgi:glycerophosphoryl diester phosphodiesterase
MTLLALAVLLSTLAAETSVPLVAHRGESADAPENTLAAFNLAWERKVAAVELDVHLTKDGKLICCHDADTKRTSGVSKLIKDSTVAELQQLDAGSWKGKQFAGEKMPLLEEALATIPEQGRCLIEVKVGPEAIPALVEAVENSGKSPEQLIVISFSAPAVAEAKRRLPQLKAYYLVGFKRDKQTGDWTPTLEQALATAKKIKADGLDVSHQGPIDEAFVRSVREAGLELHGWTVDDPQIARRLIALGFDSITTNRPAALRKELSDAAE